ncbi:MAG: hypothetical protein QM765_36455 [Myxococcales bacterium]
MSPRLSLALTLLTLAALPSCTRGGSPASEGALTEEQVIRYVEAFRAVRKAAPKLAERLEAGEQVPAEAASQSFAGIEGAVRQAGFPSYAEFVRTNGRIVWAFNSTQGAAFLDDFAGRLSEGVKELQAAIDDKNVPEEVKKELRAQVKSMKADFAKNEHWVTLSKKLTGGVVDPATVEVLLRHRPELADLLATP